MLDPTPLPLFGAAEYLGSTTPIIGASLDDLSLSPDGITLWGSVNYWEGLPSGLLSWNLRELIKAAEAHSLLSQGTTRPIPFDRIGTVGSNTQIAEATPAKLDYGWVFGMAGVVDAVPVDAGEIHYGDIAKLDIMQLIREKLYYAYTITGFNESRVTVEGQGRPVTYKTTVDGAEVTKLLSAAKSLSTTGVVLEAATAAKYDTGDFSDSGILFIAPTLDMDKLRKGERLSDGTISIMVNNIMVGGFTRNFLIKITVKDFAAGSGSGSGLVP